MKEIIKISSKENGLPAKLGKDAYPLHKRAAEMLGLETKYGNNGLNNSKKGK